MKPPHLYLVHPSPGAVEIPPQQSRPDCNGREALLRDVQIAITNIVIARACHDEVFELAAWCDYDRATAALQAARGAK